MKRVLPYFFLFTSCNSKNEKLQIDKKDLICFVDPAFMEHSQIRIQHKSETADILLYTHLSQEIPPDTFYYKKVNVSKKQIHFLDTAFIESLNSLTSEVSNGVRDGISMSFVLTNSTKTDTVNYSNPKRDGVGYRISLKAIDFYRSIFHDSLISSYFDEVQDYYIPDATRPQMPSKMTPMKRRREQLYPHFRYRR